jgi:hypothetical protein
MSEEGRCRGLRRLLLNPLVLGALLLAALLAVLVVAAWPPGARHRRRYAAKVAELHAAGQLLTAEQMQARHEEMPADRNSALVLLDAFDRMDTSDLTAVLAVGSFGRLPSEETLGLIGDELQANAAALELMRRAAELPGGAYPIVEENPIDDFYEHLRPLRAAAKLCSRSALWHAANDRTEESLDAVCLGLGLSRSLGRRMSTIEICARCVVCAATVAALEDALGLCRPHAEALANCQAELLRERDGYGLPEVLVWERSTGYLCCTLAYIPREARPLYQAFGGWLARDALFYQEAMDRFAEAMELPLPERVSATRRVDEDVAGSLRRGGARYFLSNMLVAPFGRLVEEDASSRARLTLAAAALAVERRRIDAGTWPDSLAALVPEYLGEVPLDPFTGAPVRYVIGDRGVLLYSIGPNGRDDGGLSQEDAAQHGAARPKDWDLTFRLLHPELRGCSRASFRDEVMEARPELGVLEAAGYTRERLLEVGLTEDDLASLGAQ